MEIKRNIYLNKLISKKHNGLIKVVTGIRRCGKSYLLFNLFKKHLLAEGVDTRHIIEIAFDSFENKKFRDPEVLYPYMKEQIQDEDMYYVLLDEVQLLDEFEAVLNSLIRMKNVDIYVTGSNSKLLSQDVMTAFRGRGDQVRVFPLSFKEYYDFVGGDKSEVYELYALYGGMPQLLSFKRDEEKVKYLKNLFSEVYFKDISERYIVKLPDVLTELTDDLCSSVGSLTNAKKIADTLESVKNIKVSTSTIAKYLEYLIESFMFSEAKRYDVKGKKYFEYPLKYYCTDVGLRNARLNFRQQEETHIMENIIYNELIIRGYSVDVGVVEIIENAEGKKRRKQCEIDFVVNMGARRYYIQSLLSVSDPDKMTTELRPLKNTKDFFKKIIISKSNAKPWIDEDGIVHIGLYDFLLNQNSLEL